MSWRLYRICWEKNREIRAKKGGKNIIWKKKKKYYKELKAKKKKSKNAQITGKKFKEIKTFRLNQETSFGLREGRWMMKGKDL